jgi:hypothetical protein
MITEGAVSLAPPYTAVVGSVVYTFPTEIAGEIHNAVVHLSDRKELEQGAIVHRGFDAQVEIFGNDLTEALPTPIRPVYARVADECDYRTRRAFVGTGDYNWGINDRVSAY